MIDGLDQLVKKLNKLTPTMKKEIKAANREALQGVAELASVRAPVVTGRLAKTLKPFVTTTGGGVQVGGVSTPYAKPIHFGTGPRFGMRGPHNITPNPFLYDAFDARRDEVIARYEAAVAKAIAQEGL